MMTALLGVLHYMGIYIDARIYIYIDRYTHIYIYTARYTYILISQWREQKACTGLLLCCGQCVSSLADV